jgi:preprotein translocase subunit SecG
MTEILLVLHTLIALALIAVILIQRPSTDGMGGLAGGGQSMGGMMSGRASANLLTRITAILATLFIANSLLLSIIASNADKAPSIIEKIEQRDETFGTKEQPVTLGDESIKPIKEPDVQVPIAE